MDEKTKNMIGVVLFLLGIAAVGVIAWDYLQYLVRKGGIWHMSSGGWRWSSGEVFQILAGLISVGAGIFMLLNGEAEKKQ